MTDRTARLRHRFLLALGASAALLAAQGCDPAERPARDPSDEKEDPKSDELDVVQSGDPTVLALPKPQGCAPRKPSPPGEVPYPSPGCEEMTQCREALAEIPAQHYPAPFERCAPGGPASGIYGTFDAQATAEARKDAPSTCCYQQIVMHPVGRPVRDEGGVVVARFEAGAGWTDDRALDVPADLAPALADRFVAIAAIEHSSVAAFSALSLQLLSLGAPASLVEAAHHAALDEISHARSALSIARAIDGVERAPATLPLPAIDTSLFALVRDTVIDGCYGEALGALEATAAAERCADPDLARSFERVAEDETRHAELAYRIVAWALERDAGTTRAAIAAGLAAIEGSRDARGDDDPRMGAYGILPSSDRRALRHEALAATLLPCLSPR